MSGLFFIIHQESDFGRGMKVWKKVKKELKKRNVSFRSFYTEYVGHAEVLARQIATIQDYRLKTIIGVGGEETINGIVNGLSTFTNVQMGFVYTGPRNQSLADFSLPSHPVKAVKDLIKRMNRPLNTYDLGEYQIEGKNAKKYFFNRLVVGLLTKALEKEKTNSQGKKGVPILGHVRFMTGFLKVLWKYEPFSLSLIVNDEESYRYDDVWFIVISNRPNHCIQMKIAPNANSKDGLLNVTIVNGISRFKLFYLFFFNRVGIQKDKDSMIEFTCEKLIIKPTSSQKVLTDGDLIGEGPVFVKGTKSHNAFLL